MSKCLNSEQEASRYEQHKVASTAEPLFFKSPLIKALRAHFESYQGLTEPRLPVDTLRPDRDDL